MAKAEYDVTNFDALRISLASAEDIRGWSHGEVKKAETINYRTLKPEKDGLFCEKIFGPTKDWECACGKYKRIRYKGIVCERCGVEVTRSKVRRERMGHIELAAPVSHIWYFKGTPSRLGYLLDIPPKDLEKVLYFASSIITSVDKEAREADEDDLHDEMEADLEELDAERDRVVESTRRLSTDYKPESDDFTDEVEDDERLTPEEVEDELADIYEDYNERKALRTEAYETFMKIEPKQLISDEALYREMRTNYSDYFTGGMGAEAIRDLLESIDLKKTAEELNETINESKGQKRTKAVKRLKVVDAFLKSDNNPADMILDVIPVLPPDLRPMVQLDGGRFAASDLNDLYRRVINRNNRLKRLLDLGAPEIIVNNEKRMLQEAVDSLFDNGRRGRAVTGPGNRPLKSLSDMLKGKQGRFRQNLLGKRVDYSGRSVIVVEPKLTFHQCGVPTIMALELFKPFVIKRLVELGYANNVKAAKHAIDRQASYVWDVLDEVVSGHPVLLNRAPTLHRLGIQAFEPVLTEGKAIKLHPLACHAFNADFDGDQMAIHVPLSDAACAEARVLMLSSNNIKSPANGNPMPIPSQDMIIGMYYLTSLRDGFPGEGKCFSGFKDAIYAYDAKEGVDLQAKIKVRLDDDIEVASAFGQTKPYKKGEMLDTSIGRVIFNRVFPKEYPFLNCVIDKSEIGKLIGDCCNRYEAPDIEPILDGLKSVGFHYATLSGLTVSIYDATEPDEKAALLAEADKKVEALDEDFDMGLLSAAERHQHVVDVWSKATEDIGKVMWNNYDHYNPIYIMANSGARGNQNQVRQLSGMIGLMSNPKGEIIDRPIKSNFRDGLSVLEYFIAAHGARKGLTDTALRTADSGYLTRRLVDVSQDVIVRELDCGTTEGVDTPIVLKGKLNESLIGRCLMEDAEAPDGTVVLKHDEYISGNDILQKMLDAGIEEVNVRTVMTCHAEHGVCQKCYGWDLSTSRPVNIGTAVGIIAAQSIGEPGTQLTMRTFHGGGVAGEDITQGLPRVSELFEARNPKGEAVLSEIDGTLQVSGDKEHRVLTVHDQDGNVREYDISPHARLMDGLSDGDEVHIGQQLTRGSINPHKLLELTDVNTTLRYIVDQVQDVYVSQGVEINDKHIEVIARQMLRKVTIIDKGDSDYLPGRNVNRYEFEKVANELILEGKKPPVAQPLLLGITKASLATESWLSAASFQETTKVLTDAAIEGRTDHLEGLKENVIIGKPIPAGTGLPRYRNLGITYKGVPVNEHEIRDDELPQDAPESLRKVEEMLPQPQDWSLDGVKDGYQSYLRGAGRAGLLSDEEAHMYLQDDLGVSQRWANKFSEAGIDTVGDLAKGNYTEDDLLHIDGIGAKAIEELKAGLKAHGLSRVIVENKGSQRDDMNQLLDIVFSPDDQVLIGGDKPRTFNNDNEEMLGESLPPRSYHRNYEELDELFNGKPSDLLGEIDRANKEHPQGDDIIGAPSQRTDIEGDDLIGGPTHNDADDEDSSDSSDSDHE